LRGFAGRSSAPVRLSLPRLCQKRTLPGRCPLH
jgi:hypothetical protein